MAKKEKNSCTMIAFCTNNSNKKCTYFTGNGKECEFMKKGEVVSICENPEAVIEAQKKVLGKLLKRLQV